MKTTVEINGTVYEVVPQRFLVEGWVPSCNLCDFAKRDFDGLVTCVLEGVFDCRDYDTKTYHVHLKKLAKPSIGLNTPSEARRRAIV